MCLDAAKLPEGKLAEWRNTGTLGGSFSLDPEPERRPVAGVVAGRRAVSFDGTAALLASSAPTPSGLAGAHPFTVEAWVYNPSLQTKKTFMDWHGDGGAEFGCGDGRYNAPSAFANGTDGFNVAWDLVYSGGRFGTVAIYADGKLQATEERVSLNTRAGLPMHLGTAWNTEKGTLRMLSGSIRRLVVYDHTRSAAEIRASAAQ